MISIITPSYNQCDFLTDTVSSVYENKAYEYLIYDGGSNDGTVEYLKKLKYDSTFWISEPDNGQAHAINKGFKKVTGDIIAWINSDDVYLPGTFKKIEKAFQDPKVMWVTGDCEVIDNKGRVTEYYKTELPNSHFQWLNMLVRGYSFSFIQPSTFWRKKVLNNIGLLDESLHYSFDHEFFLRIFKKYGPPLVLDEPLAQFRLHQSSKTVSQKNTFNKENRKIGLKYAKYEPWKSRLYLWGVYLREKYLSEK